MPKMEKPRELFLHELGDVLFAEKLLEKELPKLAGETSDPELKRGFERHARETMQHVKRLEQVFKKLGAPPKAARCPGIEGIKQEHDEFVSDEEPEQEVLDSFLTGAAARTEHYEIAAYSGLITMARAMRERDAVRLLEQNLRQEKETLRRVEKIARRLAQEGAKKERTAQGDGGTRRRTTSRRTTTTRSRARR